MQNVTITLYGEEKDRVPTKKDFQHTKTAFSKERKRVKKENTVNK
jgi:hypothetical protein